MPWILAALIALPAIWWLLRVTPPAPRRVVFPPLRLSARVWTRRRKRRRERRFGCSCCGCSPRRSSSSRSREPSIGEAPQGARQRTHRSLRRQWLDGGAALERPRGRDLATRWRGAARSAAPSRLLQTASAQPPHSHCSTRAKRSARARELGAEPWLPDRATRRCRAGESETSNASGDRLAERRARLWRRATRPQRRLSQARTSAAILRRRRANGPLALEARAQSRPTGSSSP